jgi:hypothetical protein
VLLDEPDLHGLLLDLSPVPVPLPTSTADGLAALREHGALVALRVTTAGLPELQRLGTVRPDVVRLSPELVRRVDQDAVRERLMRLVVQIAGDIGAVTLACGIERFEEVQAAHRHGVALGQGWFFGRARPGLLPPDHEACARTRTAARDLADLTTVGGLVVPAELAGGWRARLDGAGRLQSLVDPDGRERRPSELVRLRPGQDVGVAARRVLGVDLAQLRHEWAEAVPVIDERGGVIGVVSVARLLAVALCLSEDARAGGR